MHSGRAGGFIYIGLLIGLAIVGISLGAVSEVWTQSRQRERERELLFAGNQIRQAITLFYLASPPANRRFPLQLEELVEDVRTPDKPGRYLRRIYLDPISGSEKWGEVRLASGQLVGVYSLSDAEPIKSVGFALRDKDFADKTRYSEWVFRSALPAANPLLAPGASYTGPGAVGQPSPRTTPAGETRPQPQTPTTAPISPPSNTPRGFIQPLPRRR
jgi:type II secretory pathway pseudopilin PulG